MRQWTEQFRKVLKEATPSVGQVAEEAGYARITLDAYLNRREPSRRAAQALAEALEDRADRLATLARELGEAADERRDPDAPEESGG